MFRCFLFLISLSVYLLGTSKVWAEYRVFELEVTTFADTLPVPQATIPLAVPAEVNKTIIISNLDPDQYRGYHTINANQRIRYISTWRCPGRTANKDYCPNPKVKTEDVLAAVPLENK